MTLTWQDRLSVGNDSIDHDHRHLIDLINETEKALKAKDVNFLSNTLDKLMHYSAIHFESEEKIAKAVGFPGVEHMHSSHQALTQTLHQVQTDLGTHWSDELIEEVVTLLRSWLIDHVIKEDLLMKPYLTKHAPWLVAR